MTDAWFEVAFGAHYPALYAHRDSAEAALCFELLPTMAPLSPHGKPVLDLGCGDGRHLEFLVKAGLPCLGLDLSSPLLELASQRSLGTPLIRGDMRSIGLKDQSLDSVLSLFTAFGYFGRLQDNVVVVEEVSRILCSGGHWFLDYFNCDRVVQELGNGQDFIRERAVGNMKIRETRRYSAQDSQVSKEVELHPLPSSTQPTEPAPQNHPLPLEGLRYTEKVAVFSLAEMDQLALKHGLERVASAGSYEGAELSMGHRWILVYRKTKMQS